MRKKNQTTFEVERHGIDDEYVLYTDFVKEMQFAKDRIEMMADALVEARDGAAKLVLSKDSLTTENASLHKRLCQEMTKNDVILRANRHLESKVFMQKIALQKYRKRLKESKTK